MRWENEVVNMLVTLPAMMEQRTAGCRHNLTKRQIMNKECFSPTKKSFWRMVQSSFDPALSTRERRSKIAYNHMLE